MGSNPVPVTFTPYYTSPIGSLTLSKALEEVFLSGIRLELSVGVRKTSEGVVVDSVELVPIPVKKGG